MLGLKQDFIKLDKVDIASIYDIKGGLVLYEKGTYGNNFRCFAFDNCWVWRQDQ